MEKLDAIVAAAGGAILVVAVIGAALSGGGGGTAFDVAFKTTTKAGAPIAVAIPPAGGRATVHFNVTDANVSAVSVKAFFNTTGNFPTGANVHLSLASPAGKKFEKDGAIGASGTVQTFFAVEDAAQVASPPNATRVDAASAEAAVAKASPANATAGTGDWTLDVTFAPAGPIAPADLASVALPSWTTWSASATAASPASK